MSEITRKSPLVRAANWFDPRYRTLNMLGFILNRVTALGLTIYLFLHLGILSQLASGPGAYDKFLAAIHNPVFTFFEVLVITAGFLHGLNGIRIMLNSLGFGVRNQKALMIVLLSIGALVSLYFAVRMFMA